MAMDSKAFAIDLVQLKVSHGDLVDRVLARRAER
jgi:hypothetical protein